MSSTPRAKPMVAKDKEGAKPADKKPKAKKPKGAAPTAPVSLGMPMNKPAELSEDAAKADLEAIQQKYGALVVNFNNQQAELAAAQKRIVDLEAENERLKVQSSEGFSADDKTKALQEQVTSVTGELRSLEAANMALQKK